MPSPALHLKLFRKFQNHWVLRSLLEVVWPFVVTRLMLLIVAYLALHIIPINPQISIPQLAARGWYLSPHWWIDVWARWDAGWYYQIAQRGYWQVPGDLTQVQNPIAFFPLFPMTVRLLSVLIPTELRTSGAVFLLGLVVSNLFCIGALVLLHRIVAEKFNAAVAQRTVWYVLVFPAAFFLSSFYTESALLFFAVAAFFFAERRRWWLAAVCGGCAALARTVGVLLVVPLTLMYLQGIGWQWRQIRPNILVFALIPLACLGYFAAVYPLTGDWLGPIHAQAAWGRVFTLPWKPLLTPNNYHTFITPMEQIIVVVFLIAAVLGLRQAKFRPYAVFGLLLLGLQLTAGSLDLASRQNLVMFPVFVVLAQWGERPKVDSALRVIFFALQIGLFMIWTRFYWVA